MDIIVREANVEDDAAIGSVLQSVDWLWAAEWSEETLEAAARRFLESSGAAPSSVVLIAERAGEGLGFVALHLYPSIREGWEGYVSHLFVRAGARGAGVGRRLLAAAEEAAKARGCGRLMLYVNRPRPAYQRGFYVKVGWQEHETAALFFRKLT